MVVVVPYDSARAFLPRQLDYTLRVGALGHQVAGQHQAIAALETAGRQQVPQLIQAAVDVADTMVGSMTGWAPSLTMAKA